MTLPVYPGRDLLRGLSYGQKWSPMFFNMPTQTAVSGADIDLGLAEHPLHDFELTYGFLRDGPIPNSDLLAQLEFKTLMGFHLQLGGALGRFLYLNIDDYQVFQNVIGTGDGATTSFTLTRTFGANGYTGTEPVGQVNTGELFNAYLNGSGTPVNPSLYTVDDTSPCANTIVFDTAPPNGQAIAVDMSYWYYCKLGENSNTFEKFMSRLWNVGKVRLHSCRPGA
jgi:hypothetical protein